jgi:hypothetical protein
MINLNYVKRGFVVGLMALTGCTVNNHYGSDGEETSAPEVNYDCTEISNKLMSCGSLDEKTTFDDVFDECSRVDLPKNAPEWTECIVDSSCNDILSEKCKPYELDY